MKLTPEEILRDLIKVKENLKAPDIFVPNLKNPPQTNTVIYGITKELTNGPLKLIVAGDKNIEDGMEQRLLYIPQPNRKFHFMECKTMREMRQNNRGERYIVTNCTTDKFEIVRDGYKVKEHLDVCKNCLFELNYRGYRTLKTEEQQNQAVKNFKVKEFFENCKPLFSSLPLRSNKTILIGDEYDRNWKSISKAYRAAKGWCCEKCGVDLHDRQNLLHTHHINGVKHDIRSDNIRVLCVLCHSEQPEHAHLKTCPGFEEARSFILQKRREMNISISDPQTTIFDQYEFFDSKSQIYVARSDIEFY